MKQLRSYKTLLQKARNPEHYQFHKWITTVLADKINAVDDLQAEFTAYVAAFKREKDVYLPQRRQEGTEQVKELDAKRDALFRSFRLAIESAVLNLESATKPDADALLLLIDTYKTAEYMNYVANTALIDNFVEDARKDKYAAHITALGLTELVNNIETANDEFDAVFNDRIDWIGEQKEQGNMVAIRPLVDTAFGALADKINVLYQANELTAKEPAVQTQLGELISDINNRLDKIATLGGSSSTPSAIDPEPPVTPPTDPHNPDNLPEIRISEVKVTNNENLLLRADDPTAFNQYMIDSGYNKAEAPGIVFVEYVKPTEKKLYFYQLDSFEAELDAEMSPIMVGLNLSPSNGKLFVVPFTEDTLANPYDCFLCLDAYTHLALLNVKKPKETLIPPEK